MNERFEELLPWYVNGTLGAEDRVWLEQYAAEHPETQAQIHWYRELQSQIRASAPQIVPTLGLERVLNRIGRQPTTGAGRVRRWLGGLAAGAVAAIARPIGAVALMLIVLVQGGVIYRMQQEVSPQQQLRATNTTPSDEGPLLRVNFSPAATEADMRMLLVSLQASLAGGPGQLGDYYLRVPRGRESAAADRLRAERIVQAVELVPGLPARY